MCLRAEHCVIVKADALVFGGAQPPLVQNEEETRSKGKTSELLDSPLIGQGEALSRVLRGYRKHSWRPELILCDLFFESSGVGRSFWVGMLISN